MVAAVVIIVLEVEVKVVKELLLGELGKGCSIFGGDIPVEALK